MNDLIDRALSGDKKALEELLDSVQDLVFSLSLRMLGMIPDAEDASQEILLKLMTHLSSFKKESAFTTWVYRIAVNHLLNYRKHMFAERPLSFEYYASDIVNGSAADVPAAAGEVDQALLERELKLSCSNVMLQCLEPENRLVFILGTMFQVDSRVAGEILGITADSYRQKLSRARKRMADFLSEYCGLSGSGCCSCKKRIPYAIATHRLNPARLEYGSLSERKGLLDDCTDAMEEIDHLSLIFNSMPLYRATENTKMFLNDFLKSDCCTLVRDMQREGVL